MKTNDILSLDYTKQANKEIIDKVLLQIKPFAKYEMLNREIPINDLEKLLVKLSDKYMFSFKHIFCSFNSEQYKTGCIYNCDVDVMIEGKVKQSRIISACCIRELFAKIAIFIYSKIKDKTIKLRFDD